MECKITLVTERMVVLDDVFPDDLWRSFRHTLARETLQPSMIVSLYSRHWEYNASFPYSTKSFMWKKGPPETWFGAAGACFSGIAAAYPDHVGEWNDIDIHTHLFGRGTKITWHMDTHSAGSFTWYFHETWSTYWGGELFVPCDQGDASLLTAEAVSFGHAREDAIRSLGTGYYVAPLPNRCILLAPGTCHAVNRVDPSAGDHLRCTVVGFLVPVDKT